MTKSFNAVSSSCCCFRHPCRVSNHLCQRIGLGHGNPCPCALIPYQFPNDSLRFMGAKLIGADAFGHHLQVGSLLMEHFSVSSYHLPTPTIYCSLLLDNCPEEISEGFCLVCSIPSKLTCPLVQIESMPLFAQSIPHPGGSLKGSSPRDGRVCAHTGPEAIAAALRTFTADDVEAMAKEGLQTGRKTKRPTAVKLMRYAHGMRRNNIQPADYLISRVPVIPPKFRPFSVMGDAFIAGDANELYKDLFDIKESYDQLNNALGPEAARKHGSLVYDATKALYGFGDPVQPKTKQRGVSGFLKKIVGSQAKFGFFQRRMISKTIDNSARGVIGVDPELDIDQVGIPEEMGWKIYSPYIHRRLVRSGLSGAQAAVALRDKTEQARQAMVLEGKERPVIYSRAPAWHKYNAISAYPKFIKGESIMISPLVTTGIWHFQKIYHEKSYTHYTRY